MALDLSGMPLSMCFARLQAAYREVDDSGLAGSDPKLQRRVAEGLALAGRCGSLVGELAVFSSNEELEDVNTGDIKYLLVPFFHGELLLRLQEAEEQGSHDERIEQLRAASRSLTAFLRDVEARKALRAEAKAGWEEVGSDRPADPGAARTLKIARLRAAKRAKETLAALEARSAKGAAAEAADADTDEDDRETALLTIEVCAHTALDSLRATSQELEMLQEVEKVKRQHGGKMPQPPAPAPPASEEVPAGLQTLNLSAGSVVEMRAGANGRLSYGAVMDQLHTGIVPGLFSLSVEEGMRKEEAERAMAEAERMRQMGTRAEERRRNAEKGYDSEEEAEELRKARAKDEWKDTHTRGAGNRKNRS